MQKRLLTSLLGLICFLLVPFVTHAAVGCFCYFGEKNDCDWTVQVSSPAACDAACQTKYPTEFKNSKSTSNLLESAQWEGQCRAANQLANNVAPEPAKGAVVPDLEIEIPGVEFTPVMQRAGTLEIHFLAEFLNGLYKYLLGISFLVGIVMVIVGGGQWALSAGIPSQASKAKTRIKNAVIGLLLLMCVTLILQTVNPQLALLKPISISTIPEQNIDLYGSGDEDRSDAVSGSSSGTSSGESITVHLTALSKTIDIPLSTKDKCLLTNYAPGGSVQTQTVSLFGKNFSLNKVVAGKLQEAFNQLNNSQDPVILQFRNFLGDNTNGMHLDNGSIYHGVNGSGAFTKSGHIATKKFVETYGKEYGYPLDDGVKITYTLLPPNGLEVTAFASFLQGEMFKSGVTSYKNNRGDTKQIKKVPINMLQGGHVFGLAFDFDDPWFGKHPRFANLKDDSPTKTYILENYPALVVGGVMKIPQQVKTIIEQVGEFKLLESDPSHFDSLHEKRTCP